MTLPRAFQLGGHLAAILALLCGAIVVASPGPAGVAAVIGSAIGAGFVRVLW